MVIRNAYDAWASTYDTDANLTRDLDQRATRETLGTMQPTAILEIGCGTGKNTALLAEIGSRVHGLDFSEGMLRRARERVPSDHVTFAIADLTAGWPIADRAVDLIVCNLMLEHIEGLAWVFREAYRCLGSSGTMFVCELHPYRQYLGRGAVFQQGEQVVTIPAFTHHISAFLAAASAAGFGLAGLKEWWHEEDRESAPRLVSFLFEK